MSVPLLFGALGLFVMLLCIQVFSKIGGVYFFARKYLKKAPMYSTLLMTTGLTFGTIAAYFGLDSGMINVTQYSVLIGVIVFPPSCRPLSRRCFLNPTGLIKKPPSLFPDLNIFLVWSDLYKKIPPTKYRGDFF